jgi:WD40 repeat protein
MIIPFLLAGGARPLLITGNDGTPRLTVYAQDGSTFTRQSDPSDLPGSNVRDLSFSDAGYLVVSVVSSPFIMIYTVSGVLLTRIANPSTLPSAASSACGFSASATWLAVGQAAATPLLIYKRTASTFSTITPPSFGGTNPLECMWSPDETYLAVIGDTQTLEIYKRTGDSFAALSPPGIFTGTETAFQSAVAWSADATYLAYTTSNKAGVLKRSGDTFSDLSFTSPGAAWGCAFAPNGNFLAVGIASSPFIKIYARSGDTFTALSDPASLPAAAGIRMRWSADSSFLSVGMTSTPYIFTYSRSGSTFTALSNPATLPAGAIRGISYSPVGVPGNG